MPLFSGNKIKNYGTGIDNGEIRCYNYSRVCNKFVIFVHRDTRKRDVIIVS